MGQAINPLSMRMMGRRLIPMMGAAPFITLKIAADLTAAQSEFNRQPSIVVLGDPSAPKPGGVILAGVKPSENPIQPAPGVKPLAGRNEPCPCGSGKKYKRCHL